MEGQAWSRKSSRRFPQSHIALSLLKLEADRSTNVHATRFSYAVSNSIYRVAASAAFEPRKHKSGGRFMDRAKASVVSYRRIFDCISPEGTPTVTLLLTAILFMKESCSLASW